MSEINVLQEPGETAGAGTRTTLQQARQKQAARRLVVVKGWLGKTGSGLLKTFGLAALATLLLRFADPGNGADSLPEGAYTVSPTMVIGEEGMGGGGTAATAWVTIIVERNGESEPVWVKLEGSEVVWPGETPEPTAVLPTPIPTMTQIPSTPSPTAQEFPTALTATPTPIVPLPTSSPTLATPSLPTVTPGGERLELSCDKFPCFANANDLFITPRPFRFKTGGVLNIRARPTILADPTGSKTAAGAVYDVWSVYIKQAGASGERWACMDNVVDCQRWFAVQGDFLSPFEVIEIYATDVTQY